MKENTLEGTILNGNGLDLRVGRSILLASSKWRINYKREEGIKRKKERRDELTIVIGGVVSILLQLFWY